MGGATPSQSGAMRLMLVLMLINVVAYLDRSILSLAAPAVREDLHLTNTQLSILLGFGFVLSFVILGLLFGWLADRMSRRVLIFCGVTFWSLAAGSAGLARDFWTMLAARIGVGAGEASLQPAAYSMIADGVPRNRIALASAVYGASSAIGAAVSFAIGGLLLGAAMAHGPFQVPVLGELKPWQIVLLASGVPGLLLAPLMFVPREPARRDKSAGAAPSVRELLRFMGERWGFYACCIGGFSLLQVVSYGVASWHPTYMVDRFGWQISTVGLVLSIGMVGAFIGAFLAGAIVDKLMEKGVEDAAMRWCAGVSVFCGLTMGAAFLVGDPWICVILAMAGQFVISLIGIISTALQRVTPNEFRGQVSGVMLLFSNLIGFGLGPLIPALLTDNVLGKDQLGPAVALTVLIAGPLGGLVMWIGCGPMRKAALHAKSWMS